MSQPPKKTALALIFLTVFIDLLGFGIVLPLVPIYSRQLAAAQGLSDNMVRLILALIMTSFPAMQFLFAPFGEGFRTGSGGGPFY